MDDLLRPVHDRALIHPCRDCAPRRLGIIVLHLSNGTGDDDGLPTTLHCGEVVVAHVAHGLHQDECNADGPRISRIRQAGVDEHLLDTIRRCVKPGAERREIPRAARDFPIDTIDDQAQLQCECTRQ